jgi:hypothetical protein
MSNSQLQLAIGSTEESTFKTITGTPQGDGLSPLLFIVYLEAALRDLRELLQNILDPPAELFPPNGPHNPPQDIPTELFELAYADDLLFATNSIDFANTIRELVTPTLAHWDLYVNEDKTTVKDLKDIQTLRQYKHLGTYLDPCADLDCRIALASQAFYKLSRLWLRKSLVTLNTRLKIYNACIPPILLYNLQTAGYTQAQMDKLDAFHRRQLRSILKTFPTHRVKTKDLYYITQTCPLSKILLERRWDLFGHILRRDPQIPANIAMRNYYEAHHNTGVPGPPPTSLPVNLHREIQHSLDIIPGQRSRSLQTSADFQYIQDMAQHHRRTGISLWRNLKARIVDESTIRYSNRIEQAKLSRRSIRLREIQEASPNTLSKIIEADAKYRPVATLKPVNLITPPYMDFRNSSVQLTDTIRLTLNQYLDRS